MKINLLFPSNSISKVVANTCLLIIIVASVHALSAFAIFDSHISNINKIKRLSEFKMGTLKLTYAITNQQKDIQNLLSDIKEKLAPNELLKSSWLNTQAYNEQSMARLNEWRHIEQLLSTFQYENANRALKPFYAALDPLIVQSELFAK